MVDAGTAALEEISIDRRPRPRLNQFNRRAPDRRGRAADAGRRICLATEPRTDSERLVDRTRFVQIGRDDSDRAGRIESRRRGAVAWAGITINQALHGRIGILDQFEDQMRALPRIEVAVAAAVIALLHNREPPAGKLGNSLIVGKSVMQKSGMMQTVAALARNSA